MKKSIILALCIFSILGVSAQETQKEYLPKAGDWSIGVDLLPVFKTIGSALHPNTVADDNTAGSSENGFGAIRPTVSIIGKYMFTDNWGIRANIGLLFENNTRRVYTDDDAARLLNPLGSEKVVDAYSASRNGASFMLGAEYRKGQRRVQGVFGAGVLFAFSSQVDKYTFGNALTEINQQPTSAFAYYDSKNYRVTKEFGKAPTFYAGIVGSAGFEWFMAPKISLGMEVSFTAYYICGTQTYTLSEGYNIAKRELEEFTELRSPGNTGFYIGTDCLGGALNLNFYF